MVCLLLSFFQLVLEVSSEVTLDIVNKSLKAFEVLPKESFEVGLCNRRDALVAALVLGPLDIDRVTKK